MLRVHACITGEHDFRLVLAAGTICLLAAFTAFSRKIPTLAVVAMRWSPSPSPS